MWFFQESFLYTIFPFKKKNTPIWTKPDFSFVTWAFRSIDKIKTWIHYIFQRHIHWDFTQMGIKRYLQGEKRALSHVHPHTVRISQLYHHASHRGLLTADNQWTKPRHDSSFQLQIISSTYMCKGKQYVPDFYSRETCLIYIKGIHINTFFKQKETYDLLQFSPNFPSEMKNSTYTKLGLVEIALCVLRQKKKGSHITIFYSMFRHQKGLN